MTKWRRPIWKGYILCDSIWNGFHMQCMDSIWNSIQFHITFCKRWNCADNKDWWLTQRKGGIKWKYVAEQFLYYTRRRVILLLSWLSGKESVCQCLSVQEAQVQSLGQKDLWRRKWQPIPVFLPGKSHGQRGLAGYTQSMGSQRIERDLVTKQQQESMKLLERKAW